MKKQTFISSLLFLLAISFFGFHPTEAFAHHIWGNYHWARSSNPFVVRLGDNVSPQWKPYLFGAAYYWNRSSVLDVPVVAGNIAPNPCKATRGLVQVCSAVYGNTGWMGLAQLTVTGDHITGATVKLNDWYFTTARFNTSAWRNLVVCQEVGHTFGLAHQDENFSNPPLGTCMDYSSNPTPNQHPNLHDYQELLDIYRHVDTADNAIVADDTAIAGDKDYNNPSEWGRQVSRSDMSLASDSMRIAEYERDLGNGKKLNTRVIWAQK
jgi:hypothetical protein